MRYYAYVVIGLLLAGTPISNAGLFFGADSQAALLGGLTALFVLGLGGIWIIQRGLEQLEGFGLKIAAGVSVAMFSFLILTHILLLNMDFYLIDNQVRAVRLAAMGVSAVGVAIPLYVVFGSSQE